MLHEYSEQKIVNMIHTPLENAFSSRRIINSRNEEIKFVDSIHFTTLGAILPSEDLEKLLNQTKGMKFNRTVECILGYDKLIWKRKCDLDTATFLENDELKLNELKDRLKEGKKEFEEKYKRTIYEKFRGLLREIKNEIKYIKINQ